MNTVFWTPLARADLAAIDEYYTAIEPALADRIGRQAIAAGEFLANYPRAGEEVPDGWRRWRVAKTPYILLYRVMPDGVEVLRVRHGRQGRLPLP